MQSVLLFNIMLSDNYLYLEQPIVGRVIRAIQKCFHPDCFRCQSCHASLLEIGFSKNNGRFVVLFLNLILDKR
jgi:hypothetical protein